MAALPARRGGQTMSVLDPSREFEDIYNRMGQLMIISGEVTDTGGGRRHRGSRRTGRFEYRTHLPGDIKADQVSATLSDGVLTVSVPKSDAARPRHIEVSG